MMKDNVFTKYDLETGTPDEIQFEIMEMPHFFCENGEAPKQAHIHGFYQIIWFQQGIGTHYVDFKEYPITDNTLFFISPGQIHYFDESNNFKGIIIHFNESFLSDEGSSENVFLKYNVFNAFDTVPYYEVKSDDTPRLEYIVKEMQLEIDILKETINVLKKDPDIDQSALSNREKAVIIDVLKNRYSLPLLLQKLQLSKSSYYYQEQSLQKEDKYTLLRVTETDNNLKNIVNIIDEKLNRACKLMSSSLNRRSVE